MKRKVRFVFPRRQPPHPVPQPMAWPTLVPIHTPHPLGGSYCPSCGAHWPVAWFSVVPPCNCANSAPMWGARTDDVSCERRELTMVQVGAGFDDGRPVTFWAPLAGGVA